jgi:DNA-binding transcriptional LysR family regulator
MNLSLRDLECFLAFARTGQVTRAAELCGTTQPTISKALARCEREFRIPLFDRRSRSMRLTRAGSAMVTAVLDMHADYEAARQLAASLRAEHEGVLRIGMTGGVRDSLLAGTISMLVRRRPALRIHLQVGLSDTLVQSVLHDVLDLAVVPDYGQLVADAQLHPIGTDPLLPAARAGHPLAVRRMLRMSDALDFPWILSTARSAARQAFEAAFTQRKLQVPRTAMEVEFVSDVALGVMESSDVLAMVPASMLRPGGSHRPVPISIAGLRIARKLMLVTRKGQRQAPLIKDFLETAVAQWREQTSS